MTGPGDVSGAVEVGPARRPSRPRRGAVLGVTLVALLIITAAAFFRWGSARPVDPGAVRPTPSPEATGPLTVAEIYQTLAPSVVSIRSSGGDAQSARASGTGVIANADGAILTALHVVQDAGAIEVTFADGTRSAATIVAAEDADDTAVLAATTLPEVVVPAVLGGGASVGEDVVAIGDQLGLTHSATSGVVSGLGRSFAREDAADITGLIQFDAAVNPGSSGGPLVNARGETVGIVVALANPTEAGTFIGIGFAVPIGTALGGGDGDTDGPQL